ncbi:CHAT domain-containing protein [Nocardia otitidiscaviarum]|uniref:CHAT domain-containing protein n=1 Tax=Nocardia otitidiscaviarum TaxID=1823 RepID=UPI000A606593|nr:CHAT domain-containing protein [Nocardia otitidiscaviarum]MBF6133138.1 CHAT domain-containing protein [Nocardia otitidiscaviarum]MBF6486534.1 CHAT domain-containing protein [Nocardia otitidiscaviarum]
MTGRALNDQLEQARVIAQQSRLGAGHPQDVLDQFAQQVDEGWDHYRQFVKGQRMSVSDELSVLKQLAKCAAQWNELSYQTAGVFPGRDAALEWRRRRYLDLVVAVKMRAYQISREGHDEERLYLLEFDAIKLGFEMAVQLKSKPPGLGMLPEKARRRLAPEIDSIIARVSRLSGTNDPYLLYPWILAAVSRVLWVCGQGEKADALRTDALERAAPDQRLTFDLLLGSLNKGSSAETLISCLRRIDQMLIRMPDPIYSAVRAGYLTRALPGYLRAIAALTEVIEPPALMAAASAARSIADWWTSTTELSPDVTMCHLLIVESRAIALFERNGNVETLAVPVPESVIRQLVDLSIEPPDDEVRRFRPFREELSAVLAPIVSAIAQRDRVRLNPIGAAAWIPWVALKYRGSVLIAAGDIGLYGPCVKNRPRAAEPMISTDRVLVIDTSIPGAGRIERQFRQCAYQILAFHSDSDVRPLTVRQLSEAVMSCAELVFFCHGGSDPADFSGAGIRASASTVINLRDLSAIDMSNVRSAIVVACESGRANPFAPATSIAHALSYAGVRSVACTLWQIAAATVGPQFLDRIVRQSSTGTDNLASIFPMILSRYPTRMMPFSLIAR